MKILIIVATENEIFKENFNDCNILVAGIGMLNTAVELTIYLKQNNPDLVINLGVAGSFKQDILIGSVCEVINDTLSELGVEDKDKFLSLDEIGFNTENSFKVKPKTNLRKVSSITVNTVHGNNQNILYVLKRLNPDLETMEGAACMMVCQKFNIPCLQIRSISNFITERNKGKWDIPLAIKNLNAEARKIISNL